MRSARKFAATRICAKLVAALDTPLYVEERPIRVSVSLGASVYPEDGADGYDLFRRADTAMYSAKRAGGNRYLFWEDDGPRSGVATLGRAAARTVDGDAAFEPVREVEYRLETEVPGGFSP